MEHTKTPAARIIGIGIALIALGFFAYSLTRPRQATTLPAAVATGDTANLVSFSVVSGTKVSGVMEASGSIKGAYFFEGNVRVNILDANKNVLKEGHGTATSDWMTADPVAFTTTLDFTGIPAGYGYIRLMNDNPSGDPANDKWVDIPISFQ